MKAVLFDLDNTIYVGKNIWVWYVLNDIRHAFWCLAERKARKAVAGKDYGSEDAFHKALWDEMSRRLNVSGRIIGEWYYEKLLPAMPKVVGGHYEPRPGMAELIATLRRRGVKVGCLSDYPFVPEKLSALGLDANQFQTWSTEQFGAPKPMPRAFRIAAEEMGVAPEDVVVVGDRADNDAEGALAAGMKCLLVESRKSANNLGVEVLKWEELKLRLIDLAIQSEQN